MARSASGGVPLGNLPGAPALNSLTPAQVDAAVEETAATAAPAAARQVGLARRVDVREDVATLTVPTLVVVTTADAMVPPAVQRQLAAALPDATVAEIATGHMPFVEQPAQWLKLITEFLGRHPHA
ncbi:alpha/beta fold hydrolase [Streptomyces jumonjinensis]|uniref:alpha/beta fold hydrolase n=1 Tax=Streptomyces jumonjinensis TaxID=1945 RepID=UPI00378D22D4